MKKFVLTSAAVLFTSLMAAPVYATDIYQGKGCKNGEDSYCDLKIKAYVKKECTCYFDNDYVNLGKLSYDKYNSAYGKLHVKCNSEKASVTVKSEKGGLIGSKGYGYPVHWDLLVNGHSKPVLSTKYDGTGYKKLPYYVKSGDALGLTIKSHKYDFYKVYPGYKSDRLIVKVSPIVYY